MGISFLKKKRFSPFERRFPYAFAMKFQRAHWLGNFACTRVEITCARDTKIEVIDCEFPLCISLLCDFVQERLMPSLVIYNGSIDVQLAYVLSSLAEDLYCRLFPNVHSNIDNHSIRKYNILSSPNCRKITATSERSRTESTHGSCYSNL